MPVPMSYRWPALCLVVGSCLLLYGCASSVSIRDTGALTAGGTLVREFSPKIALRLDAARNSGDTSNAGDFYDDGDIELGDLTIAVTDQLGAEFDIDSVALSAEFNVVDHDVVGLRLHAGLRRTRLDLELTDALDNSYRYKGTSYGPGGGIELLLPLNDHFALMVRGGAHFYVGGDTGRETSWGGGLLIRPHPQLELLAGWFESEYHNTENRSNIEIQSSGPLVNLRLRF